MTVLPRTGDQQGQPDQQKETSSSEGQGTSKPVTQNEIESEESPQKTSEVCSHSNFVSGRFPSEPCKFSQTCTLVDKPLSRWNIFLNLFWV